MADVLYWVGWNQLVVIVMAIIIWLLCQLPAIFRRPAFCHALWLLVFIKLLTPPMFSLPAFPATVAVGQQSSKASTMVTSLATSETSVPATSSALVQSDSTRKLTVCCDATVAAPIVLPSVTSEESFSVPTLLPWALVGCGLLVPCIFWLLALRRFCQMRRLLRLSECDAGELANVLEEVSQRFATKTAVKLLVVDANITPFLWAIPGRPLIVLPRTLADTLGDEGLRSILAHELAHFLRRDHWINIFTLFVTTLFWWNPAIWLARRQLSAATEACCDAIALDRLRGSRKSYAKTLLAVVDSLTAASKPHCEYAITFCQSHSLKKRVELIADTSVSTKLTPCASLLLAVGLFAMTFLPLRSQAIAADFPSTESASFQDFCCPRMDNSKLIQGRIDDANKADVDTISHK